MQNSSPHRPHRRGLLVSAVAAALLIVGGCSTPEQLPAVDSAAASEAIALHTEKEPAMHIDNKALARTYRLVQTSGLPLTEVPPFVDPTVVGADNAIGLENIEHDLHISLFVFANQAEHEQAKGPIMAALPASNVYTLSGSNGPVLFVGYTHNDGRNGPPRIATSHLDTLGQAFAGEE